MEKIATNILVIDNDRDILDSALQVLEPRFTRVFASNAPGQVEELLKKNDFDIILLDMNFQKEKEDPRQGVFWLRKILSIDPGYIIVVMTPPGDMEKTMDFMEAGATSFVSKPWKEEKLITTITNAIKQKKNNTHPEISALIWGSDPGLKSIRNENIPDAHEIAEMERELIRKALKQYNGDLNKAASDLGFSLAELRRKMKQFNL